MIYCKNNSLDYTLDTSFVSYLSFAGSFSKRPKSILGGNVSAINKFRSALGLKALQQEVHNFVEAFIKTSTLSPMKQTPVMPVSAFVNLYKSLP